MGRAQKLLPTTTSSTEQASEAKVKYYMNKTKYEVKDQVKQEISEGLVSEHDLAKEVATGVALKMSEWRQGIVPVASRPENAAALIAAEVKSLAKRIALRQIKAQMVASVITELTPKYEAYGTFEVDRLIRRELVARMAPIQAQKIAKEKAAKVEQIRKDVDAQMQGQLSTVSSQYPNISQPEMEFRIKREIVHDANLVKAGLEHKANSDEDPEQVAVRNQVRADVYNETAPPLVAAAQEIVKRKMAKLMSTEVSETVAARLPAEVKSAYQAVVARIMSDLTPTDLKKWVVNHRKEQYGENACMPPFCGTEDKVETQVKAPALRIVPTPPTPAPTGSPTTTPTEY